MGGKLPSPREGPGAQKAPGAYKVVPAAPLGPTKLRLPARGWGPRAPPEGPSIPGISPREGPGAQNIPKHVGGGPYDNLGPLLL